MFTHIFLQISKRFMMVFHRRHYRQLTRNFSSHYCQSTDFNFIYLFSFSGITFSISCQQWTIKFESTKHANILTLKQNFMLQKAHGPIYITKLCMPLYIRISPLYAYKIVVSNLGNYFELDANLSRIANLFVRVLLFWYNKVRLSNVI